MYIDKPMTDLKFNVAQLLREEVGARREYDFDDALVKVGELQDSGHPKAETLAQLVDAIRTRVTGREYRDAWCGRDAVHALPKPLDTGDRGALSR